MAVHDGHHVVARTIDPGVDEALQIHATSARIEGLAREIEGDDIFAPDETGRHVAREQEMSGGTVVTRADVPESIDDALPIENSIGHDELVDERGIGGGRHGEVRTKDRCNLSS